MDKLKIERPAAFNGKSDKGEVETFLYQCELYFEIKSIKTDGQRVAFATLLLSGDAAVWLQNKWTVSDLASLSW